MKTCKHCGAPLVWEGRGPGWVDTTPEDAGGTYEYCPENAENDDKHEPEEAS